MFRKIIQKLDDSKIVFQRYPLVITMAFIATFCFVFYEEFSEYRYTLEETGYHSYEAVLKVGFIAMLGISLSYAMNILSQRYGKPILMQGITLALLAFIYRLTGDDIDSPLFYFPYLTLGVSSHLFVSFSGYLSRRDNDKFWNFNKNLFIEFVLTGIFSLVLALGVMLAIAGIDQLFGIDVGDAYFHAWMIIMILGSVLIFLHFTAAGLRKLEADSAYPIILKFFVLYVLIPLMLLYSVILYLYLFKIIINWSLPDGIVTYLVSAFSVFGILSILLVYPLRDTSKHTWIRLFAKVFYYVLIPLICLMAVAIYIRVDAYGVTEPRYYGILLTVWLAGIAIYFILVKDSKVRAIPMSLFVLGLISLITPKFNATRLSIDNQTERFSRLVEKLDILDDDGKIDFGRAVERDDVNELESIIRFLDDREVIENITHYVDNPEDISSYGFAQKFSNLMGTSDDRNIYAYRSRQIKTYNITSYDYVITGLDVQKEVNEFPVNTNLTITLTHKKENSKENPELYLTINDSSDSLLMNSLFDGIIQDYRVDSSVDLINHDITFSHDGYQFLMILRSFSFYEHQRLYLEADLYMMEE